MRPKLILIACMLPFAGVGQDSLPKSPTVNWSYSFLVRKGLETKDDKDKPAVVFLTWPKDDKPDSYLINAGIGMNITRMEGEKRFLEITPSFVYNRNTLIEKEQHNLKALVSANWQFGKEDVGKKSHSRAMIFPTIQHMWNRVDTSRSFFTTLYGSWIFKKTGCLSLNNYGNFGNSGVLYYFGPIIGMEYQDRYYVKTPETHGKILRFYWSTDVRLALKRGKRGSHHTGHKRFELTFNYAQRHELSSNLSPGEGTTHFLKTELSYFPLDTEKVSMGISYNEGEDPIAAIEKQNFWQLAFKLQLDYPLKKK